MGTPNIKTPPNLTIKQVTLHIPKMWANHNTEKAFVDLLTIANSHDHYTYNTIIEPLNLYRLHPQMVISCSFIYIYITSNIK
jgi:hypothetical protein